MLNIIPSLRVFFSRELFVAVCTVCALVLYWAFGFHLYARILLVGVIVVGVLPLVVTIVRSLLSRHFGVDSIALVAILASLLIGEYAASALVLIMLSGGEALERYAEGRARSALTRLLAAAPTHAHRLVEGHIEDCHLKMIRVGDVVVVKQHEVIPVDGVVVHGTGSVDQSMITGEPIPVTVVEHDRVLSGSVNGDTVLHIRVKKTHEQSTYAHIVRLVKNAEDHKAPMVRMADRYSVWFTLLVFLLAGTAYVGMGSAYLAVAVLVVATPCPLILAAPIAFIAGMSRAAHRGIIVKHGGVFEGVTRAQQILFDKTGTLTFGKPRVHAVHVRAGVAEAEVLAYAGAVEQLSTHILARSIVAYVRRSEHTRAYAEQFSEVLGSGAVGVVEGKRVSVGKRSYLMAEGMQFDDAMRRVIDDAQARGTMPVCVGYDGVCQGVIVCEDVPRPEVSTMLQSIRAYGLRTVLLTGDTRVRADAIASTLGFSAVHAECLPADKHAFVRDEEKNGVLSVMVGDGVNDAPALRAAHVGIALGSHGDTVATDAADAVIVVDAIDRVGELVMMSYATTRIATQSIVVGIGLSVVAMCAALFGYLPPPWGALLQEGIDVVVILNALRAVRV